MVGITRSKVFFCFFFPGNAIKKIEVAHIFQNGLVQPPKGWSMIQEMFPKISSDVWTNMSPLGGEKKTSSNGMDHPWPGWGGGVKEIHPNS